MVHTGLDMELDTRLWDTGLFDPVAARDIGAYLGEGVAPTYLDRLLFVLRFRKISFLFQSTQQLCHHPFSGRKAVRQERA